MTLTADQPPGPSTTQADKAFHIEQHGIDFIPESERWARPRDLFGMWFGANVNIEYFVYGAILMTFGFTFAQAVVLIILGNLSFVLLGVCSLQGPDAGTTVFAINRASYGPNGSRLISLFNWLTQIGFETEGLILIVGAGLVLTSKAGFLPGTPAKIAFIVVAVAIQLVLPLFGHSTMVKTLRALALPFVVLFAILLAYSTSHVQLHAVAHGANWQTFMVGLAFTITLSGLGWTENGNDYSRYLPRRASKPAIVGWVFLGTAVPEILVMLLGAAVGTFLTTVGTSSNPFAPFAHTHTIPSAFVVVFLVFAVVQIFAINSLDLYSSGVTLQAMGLRVKRFQAVLIDTAICLGITSYAVFNSSFKTLLNDFVAVVICWIAPWVAIFLVDWGLRKWRYAPHELQRTDPGGLYWGTGGVHWPAIVAQAAGSTASVLALDQLFYQGPIARAAGGGGADFSVFAGVVVGGVVYLVLAYRGVRRQSDAQDVLLAADGARV